ncbi:MAG: ABATE domain-containing protein [Phyllobacterium sp.]|uniref:CGNR zinc finger domain-containing protein n=1 Tax=Phyllobacterium sp. TaxID=1871046 RepID=UPI0030EFAFAD
MEHHHLPPIFIADSLGLDFLNSVATPIDSEVDWLASGDGLIDWLAQAELVPATVIAEIKASAMPGELDKIAHQARNLREWFRQFVRDRKGTALTCEHLKELESLNRLLRRDEAFTEIVGAEDGGGALKTVMSRRWRSPESLLLPIAESLARFVCEEDFSRVKACEGHACTLMFVDRTRRKSRRWCSMAICGNRAKQAAHRLRSRSDEA